MPPQDDVEFFEDDIDPEIEDAANNHGQDDYLLDEPPYADEPSDDFPDDEMPDISDAEDGEMP